MSSAEGDNSKVDFYSPPPTVKVDPDNILFVLHRRGFITCVCGKVVREHVCNLKNVFQDLKIKFRLCVKNEICRFCEDIVQWNYERYMNNEEDDKLCCRKCTKEIEQGKGICHDCFCGICYAHLADCVCCKFCPPHNQCQCDETNVVTEENLV